MFLDYSKNKQETDYRYTYLDANSSGRIIAQMVRYKIQQTRLPGTSVHAYPACIICLPGSWYEFGLFTASRTPRSNIAIPVYSGHFILQSILQFPVKADW